MEGTPESLVGTRSVSERLDPPAPANGPHLAPGFEYTEEEQAIIEQRLADLGYLE
jgi:hypothetical protein